MDRSLNAVLNASIALGGDLRLAATVADILANGIAAVAAVGEQNTGIAIALVHQLGIGGAVVRLARRQRRAGR